MTFPFYGKEFTFNQPDGTQIRVRGWGDQNYAVFETLDGFTVVKDPNTGFYSYARLSEDESDLESTEVRVGLANPRDLGLSPNIRINRAAAKQKAFASPMAIQPRRWEVRRQQRKASLRAALMGDRPLAAPPQREIKGEYVGLCLLIQFPDVPGTIPQPEVSDFCNKKGYNNYGNNGSVFDYFYDNSNGLLKYTNVVTQYYTAKNPRAYYTNPSIPYGTRARALIEEALFDLKAKGFNFNQLSADTEGYVYALSVFYAGTCPNNWSEGLWPHSWSLETPYELTPGRLAYDYQITDIGSELSLATFCHENGHMVCDFPDLYDYGYESQGTGVYCLMCAGGLADEKNPTQICAYLKYKAGWAQKVTPIADEIQGNIPADVNEFFIYAKNPAEYFIIENKQKEGRDKSLPTSGLAIWHVDELGSNNNEQMTPTEHYECALEQADNRFDLEHGTNRGDSEDLFNAPNHSRFANSTSPNSQWWDGTPSNLDIFDISAPGKVMTFRAKLLEDESSITLEESPGANIPDRDPQGIERSLVTDASGTLKDIAVSVNIAHTYIQDLIVALVSPAGTNVILHNRRGGSADNIIKTYTLANTPGLNALLNTPIQGKWKLKVADLAGQDVGKLNYWSLKISRKF